MQSRAHSFTCMEAIYQRPLGCSLFVAPVCSPVRAPPHALTPPLVQPSAPYPHHVPGFLLAMEQAGRSPLCMRAPSNNQNHRCICSGVCPDIPAVEAQREHSRQGRQKRDRQDLKIHPAGGRHHLGGQRARQTQRPESRQRPDWAEPSLYGRGP